MVRVDTQFDSGVPREPHWNGMTGKVVEIVDVADPLRSGGLGPYKVEIHAGSDSTPTGPDGFTSSGFCMIHVLHMHQIDTERSIVG